MKIIADETKKCIGCYACADICPKSCIRMEIVDNNLTAVVNEESCIKCGLCSKVCQVNSMPEKHEHIECFAAVDKKEYKTSSSGGIASSIAKYYLEKGGVVIGCALLEDNKVKHIVVDKTEDADKLKGSKYVKSDMSGVYREIKRLKDKPLCFIGTPCLVAGARKFCETLKIDDKNILFVDLVCHGTPNQYVLRDCIGDNKLKAFRDGNSFELVFENELNKEDKKYAEMYMIGFLHCLFYNQACYECPYACPERVGDVTLSDFWGLKNNQNINNADGVSMILVNTEKGRTVVDALNIYKEKHTIEEACAQNGQLKAPSVRHKNNGRFVKEYPLKGKKCLKRLLIYNRFKRAIRNVLFSNELTKKIVLKILK